MSKDPELKAMGDVYQALKHLDSEAQRRIVKWVSSKFALKNSLESQDSDGDKEIKATNFKSFTSLADVFGKANVNTDQEKVLVAASYLQSKNDADLTGREINKELNHLGHGIGNITNTISALIKKKPKLMIQTRKEGTTKQAQKKYKVTGEGIKTAKEMLNANIAEK